MDVSDSLRSWKVTDYLEILGSRSHCDRGDLKRSKFNGSLGKVEVSGIHKDAIESRDIKRLDCMKERFLNGIQSYQSVVVTSFLGLEGLERNSLNH